ncbi:hypothetical protein GOP47_0028759 [Adiantum capillus-veneris]|nr:hypothetical protein GOP47_0028759 [Adiantum capillus-veneris]
MSHAQTQVLVTSCLPARRQHTQRKAGIQFTGLEEALSSLEQGLVQLSFENFAKLLHKFRKEKDGALVLRLHSYMVKNGLEKHSSLGNHLIPLLVGIGCMHYAHEVFDKLLHPNEWSCYRLINAYINYGKPHSAFVIYDQMRQRSFAYPYGYIFVALLKACTEWKDFERGIKLHVEVARLGLLEKNLHVGSTLVSFYSKCGVLAIAEEVLRKLPVQDVVSWNALITGYVEQGLGIQALRCFKQMQIDGVFPSSTTFICILKACGNLKATSRGQEIHADIEKRALRNDNQMIGNALVDMYSKCGTLEVARYVFDQLPSRDICTWNSLIAGLAEHGHAEEGLKCFQQMRLRGISPDLVTLSCSLKVCSIIGAIREGVDIHAEIERLGLLEKDLFVGSTLVDMYAKAGLLSRAQQVFDRLSIRGVVTWTALIAGYAEKGLTEEALTCLDRMRSGGYLPNAITLVWCLKACQNAGATGKGEELHAEIERRGMLEQELMGNSLVDMYAKCGLLAKACQTFDKLPCRDVVSWTALMAGFVQFGESKDVFRFFDKMVVDRVRPNSVTFTVVLSACARIGLFSTCQSYFEAMLDDYGIPSAIEHCNCVVNVLSRAGQVEQALAMLKLFPSLLAWQSVLGACNQLGSVDFGREAYEHAVRLDEKHALAYVLMGHICAND